MLISCNKNYYLKLKKKIVQLLPTENCCATRIKVVLLLISWNENYCKFSNNFVWANYCVKGDRSPFTHFSENIFRPRRPIWNKHFLDPDPVEKIFSSDPDPNEPGPTWCKQRQANLVWYSTLWNKNLAHRVPVTTFILSPNLDTKPVLDSNKFLKLDPD